MPPSCTIVTNGGGDVGLLMAARNHQRTRVAVLPAGRASPEIENCHSILIVSPLVQSSKHKSDRGGRIAAVCSLLLAGATACPQLLNTLQPASVVQEVVWASYSECRSKSTNRIYHIHPPPYTHSQYFLIARITPS